MRIIHAFGTSDFMVIALREEGRLCTIHEHEEEQVQELRIICSLGLVGQNK